MTDTGIEEITSADFQAWTHKNSFKQFLYKTTINVFEGASESVIVDVDDYKNLRCFKASPEVVERLRKAFFEIRAIVGEVRHGKL